MCGICGVYNYGKTADAVTPEILTAMHRIMQHRGPDSFGVWLDEERLVGLAHRRLSIVDLSPLASQPMTNEDGSLQIVFNGEIYNHLELRKDLETRHRYRSLSDTETILHLYEEKGREAVKYLDGMFAFALWDDKKQELLLARDRLGKKPLYYTVQNGLFLFASEIKSILAHPRIKPELDNQALYHYLTFACTPSPYTLFTGIKKMPPAHILTVNAQGQTRLEEFWDAVLPDNGLGEDELIERIRVYLKEAVKKRMMSDVPFGVFLSGGVDSSTNVALMAQLMNQPVKTFSVGFKDQPQMNEFQHARKIAELFKTDHHEIMIDQQDLMDYIPSLIYHQDEPIADWVCVPLYFVAKLARESGVIVVQIGEGSDEIFFGYDGYLAMLNRYRKYWQPYMKMPGFLRRGVYGALKGIVNRDERFTLSDILRRAAYDQEFFEGGAIAWEESGKELLLTPEFKKANPYSSDGLIAGILAKIDREKPGADYANRMVYLELKLRLAELLLMRVDKITMSVSVEGRAPYLDRNLVELAMGVPQSLKIKNGMPKYLLKKAVEGLIPDEIIYRPKVGFGAPVREWMPEKLGGFIEESIMTSRIRERKIFDYDFLKAILKSDKAHRRHHTFLLWNIFNLSRWYDYWIAGERGI